MKENDPKPETQPAGDRLPPRPPRPTAIGFADGDPAGKKRFGKNLKATIVGRVEGEGKFIRSSGGRKQYGHVQLQIGPNEKGKGIEITDSVSRDAIPMKYSKPIHEGVRSALECEMVLGDQIVDERCIDDILVRVVGGSFDATDSSDLAFQIASIFAVKQALEKAKPVKII